MKGEERRRIIARTLTADKPISATTLAGQLSVSRQIIVGDIALMRAGGMEIVATPRGYKLGGVTGLVRAVVCTHKREDSEKELLAMVDEGCTVLDVEVEHPIYGEITGQLCLSSRRDVEQYVEQARDTAPLSSLTDGVHIHHLQCPDEAAFQRVCQRLEALGVAYTTGESGES